MRAFARDLQSNSGRISQYFSGERFLSAKSAKKISQNLHLDPSEEEYFLHLVASDIASRKSPRYRVLKDDELALTVEWHHFAITSLLTLKNFDPTPVNIAERLNIPESTVINSLQTLERLGLIRNEDGQLVRNEGPFITTSDIPSRFLRLSHKNKLQHIIDNMDKVPVEKRDLSTITFAIDERKLPQIKKTILKFRRKLARDYSVGSKNQVYMMCIELFPLSRSE